MNEALSPPRALANVCTARGEEDALSKDERDPIEGEFTADLDLAIIAEPLSGPEMEAPCDARLAMPC